jgi:hypothetical protein
MPMSVPSTDNIIMFIKTIKLRNPQSSHIVSYLGGAFLETGAAGRPARNGKCL